VGFHAKHRKPKPRRNIGSQAGIDFRVVKTKTQTDTVARIAELRKSILDKLPWESWSLLEVDTEFNKANAEVSELIKQCGLDPAVHTDFRNGLVQEMFDEAMRRGNDVLVNHFALKYDLWGTAPKLEVDVAFLTIPEGRGNRATVPNSSIPRRMDVVVGDGVPLEVTFVEAPTSIEPQRPFAATLSLNIPSVDYSALIPGAEFAVSDDGRIVGRGRVIKRLE
jgi:hypothetical protein